MTKLIKPALALFLAASLTACSAPPPPMVDAPPAPAKRCVDVKMDLDTHRNCR